METTKPSTAEIMAENKKFADSLRKAVDLLKKRLTEAPTKHTLLAMLDHEAKTILKCAATPDAEPYPGFNILRATIAYQVMMSAIDVVTTNPMYDSHALVLQFQSAVDARLDDLEKSMLDILKRRLT